MRNATSVPFVPDTERDELRRPERGEADLDHDDPVVDVALSRGVGAAADEERFLRGLSCEGALLERLHEERRHGSPEGPPRRLVVRLEVDPLDAALDALLEVEGRAPDGDVLPVLGLLAAADGAAAPHDDSVVRYLADGVDATAAQGRGGFVADRGREADGALDARTGADS